jgi:SAM-dependent methyltransferase
MQDLIVKHIAVLACPACHGGMKVDGESLVCLSCGKIYPSEDGIPRLFHPHLAEDQARDVTDIVKGFYEVNPFPNYDDLDSADSLARKASRGVFAKLLDEQIPQGAYVLEAGCGTGQLSNFLGMHWNRQVFGTDLCMNSLRLAKGFKDRCNVRQAAFLNMNLFRPCFKEQSFDVVISNGVLHHTSDPLGGFKSLGRLVKPDGYIIIGLYNTIGRLTTDWRRAIFRATGDHLTFLDGHMRNKTYNEARKRAWFMDQYKHPHESKHSYSEVIDWFEDNGFEFLFSIPKIDPGAFAPDEQLFAPHGKGTGLTRFLTELGMLLKGGKDGALFIMIGRRLGAQSTQSEPLEVRRAS